MRNLFQISVLGVFASAGVALAVSVAIQNPHVADTPPVQEGLKASKSAPVTAGIVKANPAAESPVVAANPPVAPKEFAGDQLRVLDQVLERWTASYVPAMTRQLEQLEKAQETAAKTQENANRRQEQVERVLAEMPNRAASDEVVPPGSRTPVAAPDITLAEGGKDVVSINASNSELREVLKSLSEATGLNVLATPSVAGTITISLTDVDLEQALSAILKSTGYSSRREGNFVYVGTVDEIQNMATANDQVSTRVFRPNYVTATELQKLFTPMLSKEVGMISVSTAAEIGLTSSKDKAGGDSFTGSEMLLVRDFDTILRQMELVFQEVDRMPSQVSIEAMILSVKLDDQDKMGVNFELLRNQNHIRLASGATVNSLGAIPFNAGLKVAFLDESMFALVDALETIGDTNVIASPHVMCLNKQRAEILIGSELGYVSTTVTETAATQSVEFLEVGTHLKIRPFISGDGMVRLEVHPELSTGSVRVQQGFTLPDKEVTQVTTNVMCRTGATVIIGGLIREDLVTSSTQIPVLGNLPLVGALFRQRTEDTERREIIVLLTPRIVTEPEMYAEADKSATQFRDRRNAFYDKMQPTNKRRIAEQYHRLATAAWLAGDANAALRNANLAIHYDPLHQGAVDLRQEVLIANPGLEAGVHEHLRVGLRPWEHRHRDYSAETCWPWRPLGPIERPFEISVPSEIIDSGSVRTIVTDAPRAP